tara:strand:+ start:266 stop:778 length:513 start_codon:yes stop_codon:yes gene_type:complete
MRVYKTKKGYFYKELKNGKKIRISEEQYKKLRNKIKGGTFSCRTCRMCKGCRQDTERHTATKDQIQNYLKDMTRNTTITDRTVSIKPYSRGFLYLKGPNNINRLLICNKCYNKLSIYLKLKGLLTEDEFRAWLQELSSPYAAVTAMRHVPPTNNEKKIDDLKSNYGRLLT